MPPGGISRTESQRPNPRMPMVDLDQPPVGRLARSSDHAHSCCGIVAYGSKLPDDLRSNPHRRFGHCRLSLKSLWGLRESSLGPCGPSPLRRQLPKWIAGNNPVVACVPQDDPCCCPPPTMDHPSPPVWLVAPLLLPWCACVSALVVFLFASSWATKSTMCMFMTAPADPY